MLKSIESLNYIKSELRGPVAILTINRPEVMNALSTQVVKELDQALHQLDAQKSVRVVILTGAGEKAFVAGGDIKEMQGLDADSAREFGRSGQETFLFIRQMSKPVIAAVNGYALGGGLELALACDFIYASENARFGLPEVTLGVLPGFGGTQTLARAIGPALAKELIYTGRVLVARDALDYGIVNAVFPQKDLLLRTLETANRIANNAPVAVANAKKALNQGMDQPLEDAFKTEREQFAPLYATQDQKEGMRAFLEKRPPEFKGQ